MSISGNGSPYVKLTHKLKTITELPPHGNTSSTMYTFDQRTMADNEFLSDLYAQF